ncbi:permeases of the major facilitator superfamily [Moorella thermoacetica Y72]|uniref:Permeases of the major facilitator superfamily n=1 Tax=Moorella thermoacetica Y72 TaxID=1325331 RepID=A0A0S6UEE5_NEOTH|nr:MFS transporter [Moorella thermoacetica]GAF25884.1 permeases of the major facilitator superfamily [Moorella thermoacetica Y72]
MKASMKLPFAILCTVPFIMVLGNSMLVPLLPLMRSSLNVTLVQVSLFITAFSLPAGIVIPFAGFLSDCYGRKTIMAPALIIYGAGGILAGLAAWLVASPYYLILGSRILQGIGAGGTYQLAMALASDIFQSKERTKALGLLEAANGLGKVVSPIAGAALGLLLWFAPFFVYGILAIPIGLAVWFLVREPEQGNKNKTDFHSYFHNLGQVLQEKGLSLMASILAGMIVLFILFGVLSYVSDLLEGMYGVTGIRIGLLIAIPVGTMALTSYLSGSYLQKTAGNFLKIVIIAGLVLEAAALVIMGLFANIYIFFLAMILMGFGTGVVLPAVNTLITSASARERGGITCLYGSARFFGVALGPPAFGLAMTLGKLPLFLGAAVLVGIIAFLTIAFIQTEKMLPPELLPGH